MYLGNKSRIDGERGVEKSSRGHARTGKLCEGVWMSLQEHWETAGFKKGEVI